MRPRKFRNSSLILAVVAMMSMIGGLGPAQADAASEGVLGSPFSENGTYDAAPPSTPQQALEYPTAVSAAVTPEGNIVYWDGLSGLADSNVALPLDAGRTGQTPDRSKLLILDDPDSSGWQLGSPLWLNTDPVANGGSTDNLFCADQRLLADGTVVVAGGTDYETEAYADLPNEVADPAAGAPDGLAELYGSKNTRLYNDNGDGGSWTFDQAAEAASNVGIDDMEYGRWYPALITLPSGKLLVTSGVSKLLWNSNTLPGDAGARAQGPAPVNVKETETYDPSLPAGERWSYNGTAADRDLPLFPRIHLLTNGDVFYGGVGQFWGPAGESINELAWGTPATYSPSTGAWTEYQNPYGDLQPLQPVLDPIFGARSGALSVPLLFEPDANGDYLSTRILIAGGTMATSPGTFLATTNSQIQTLTEDPSTGTVSYDKAETEGQLNNARWYSSSVLLPNGQVLVINGADSDEVISPGTEKPIHQLELYDPATDSWKPLLDTLRDRTYHNSALLLPDGSVLFGGHSPINLQYGGKGDSSLKPLYGSANNFRDPSFEIYRPPYLYNADGTDAARPDLNPDTATIDDNGILHFVALDSGIRPTSVTFTRLPSTTHITDADMRGVVLPGTPTPIGNPDQGSTEYKISVPADRDVLPPGYYYAWVSGATGAPAVAQIVNIV